MHGTGIRTLVCAILWAMALPASAEKTSVDPNGPRPASAEVKAGDTRLSQAVTCSFKRKRVSEVLDELSRTTGIALRAGRSTSDWPVRDSKLNAFVSGLPIGELMDSIARVLKCKWSATGVGDSRAYYLVADRKARLQGETGRLFEEQQRAEKRQEFVEQCLASDDLSSAEVEALRDQDPARYLLVKTGAASSLGALLHDVPSAGSALLSGNEVVLRVMSLADSARRAALQLRLDLWKMKTIETGESPPARLPTDLTLHINGSMQGRPGFVLGKIALGDVGYPIIDPDAECVAVSARAMIAAMDSRKRIKPSDDDAMDEAATRDVNKSPAMEAPIEHPDDPALHAKVKLDASESRLADLQEVLAKAAGLGVVSDSFASNDEPVPLEAKEVEIRRVLGAVAQSRAYNWEKRGGILEFRDRNWPKRRCAQIPEASLAKWRASAQSNGALTANDLAEIARLTPDQFAENVECDHVLAHIIHDPRE